MSQFDEYIAGLDDFSAAIQGSLEECEGYRAPPMPAMLIRKMFERGIKVEQAAAILAHPERRPAA